MTHLDTSFLVDLLREQVRGAPGPAQAHLGTLAHEPLGVSVLVACELYAGAAMADDAETERAKVDALLSALEIVQPDTAQARRYGSTLAELKRRGQAIATVDLLIAVAALSHDAPLVARDRRHFDRVPGLMVVGY